MSSSPQDKAKTPEAFSSLKIKKPATNSVGFSAIKASIGQASKYMNTADALKLSLKVNKKEVLIVPVVHGLILMMSVRFWENTVKTA